MNPLSRIFGYHRLSRPRLRLRFVRFAPLALLLLAVGGCCAPTELFSSIDRHCFVADWMNDHSCLSCRSCANHACGPTLPIHERTLDNTANRPSELAP
ncbi:MAG: hypothetical protein IT425_13145 [Pirellulales bacterium]|nr:hypothetical protein [Pirellulales bacterium]